jgi:hypothetical protein
MWGHRGFGFINDGKPEDLDHVEGASDGRAGHTVD